MRLCDRHCEVACWLALPIGWCASSGPASTLVLNEGRDRDGASSGLGRALFAFARAEWCSSRGAIAWRRCAARLSHTHRMCWSSPPIYQEDDLRWSSRRWPASGGLMCGQQRGISTGGPFQGRDSARIEAMVRQSVGVWLTQSADHARQQSWVHSQCWLRPGARGDPDVCAVRGNQVRAGRLH